MMQVFAREAAVYTDLMPNLNKMSEIKYCHVVHVDETQGKSNADGNSTFFLS